MVENRKNGRFLTWGRVHKSEEKTSDEKCSKVFHVARIASGKDSTQTDDRELWTRYKREDQGQPATTLAPTEK